MRNFSSEEEQRRLAFWGIVAWCVAMLFAVASFLPADADAQEVLLEPEVEVVTRDGHELSDEERALVQRLNKFMGLHKSRLIEELGVPVGVDFIEHCIPTDHGGGEYCITLARYVYLTDRDGTLLMFIIGDNDITDRVEDETVLGWVVREMTPNEYVEFYDTENPFGGTFQ